MFPDTIKYSKASPSSNVSMMQEKNYFFLHIHQSQIPHEHVMIVLLHIIARNSERNIVICWSKFTKAKQATCASMQQLRVTKAITDHEYAMNSLEKLSLFIQTKTTDCLVPARTPLHLSTSEIVVYKLL